MDQEYDFTQVLPYEIIEIILKQLSAEDLSRFQTVSWRWREFGNDDHLWFVDTLMNLFDEVYTPVGNILAILSFHLYTYFS